MPGKAKSQAEEIEAVPQPDFAKAIRIMNGDVRPSEEANAKSRGDLSAAWKAIVDDCHVNKKAAKDFYRVKNMSDELRDDYLRSLYGLMLAGNIGISQDLVDRMGEGEAPVMPVTPARPKGSGEGLAALN